MSTPAGLDLPGFFFGENDVAQRGPDESQAEMIKRTDRAVYQAKQAGKNRGVVAG